jgi:hypothetical protein
MPFTFDANDDIFVPPTHTGDPINSSEALDSSGRYERVPHEVLAELSDIKRWLMAGHVALLAMPRPTLARMLEAFEQLELIYQTLKNIGKEVPDAR